MTLTKYVLSIITAVVAAGVYKKPGFLGFKFSPSKELNWQYGYRGVVLSSKRLISSNKNEINLAKDNK